MPAQQHALEAIVAGHLAKRWDERSRESKLLSTLGRVAVQHIESDLCPSKFAHFLHYSLSALSTVPNGINNQLPNLRVAHHALPITSFFRAGRRKSFQKNAQICHRS
jgi:hypothetical protein